MSENPKTSLENRTAELREAARSPHEGIYLTGADQIELLSDELPATSFDGENFLLASFGNCRCASDPFYRVLLLVQLGFLVEPIERP